LTRRSSSVSQTALPWITAFALFEFSGCQTKALNVVNVHVMISAAIDNVLNPVNAMSASEEPAPPI
jgi:hypothetical protein